MTTLDRAVEKAARAITGYPETPVGRIPEGVWAWGREKAQTALRAALESLAEDEEAVGLVATAIEHAPAERIIEEQELRQENEEPIEVVRERIAFRQTATTQAKAALATLAEIARSR